MNFEHLIQINDLQNPLVETLNRDQVWQGLLHRVEDATPFLPGLESCTILERHADHLLRKLDFGAAVIHDRVTLVEQHWVRFDILPGEQHAGGSLTITIEEPEPGALFLRFAYHTSLPDQGEDARYAEFVRSAYHQSDLDTVRIIRMIAESGGLQQ